MAHEIDMSNGRANVAWTGSRDAVWHKLGTEIKEGTPLEDWIVSAGLDWQVESSPVQFTNPTGVTEFTNNNVLYRSDTNAPLSIVSDSYHVVQPKQIMEFYRDLVDINGFKLSSAGSLFGGKKFWCLADTGKKFDVVDGDTIGGFLLLVTSVDGTVSTQAKFTSTRVVCNNLLSVALNENSKNLVRKTHASEWNPESFKIDLGLVDESWEKFSAQMKKLTEIEVNDKFVQKYFQDKFFNPEVSVDDQTTQTYNKIQKLMSLYKTGAGSHFAPDTAYQVLQAMTDAFSHGLRAKQDPSRRMWEGSFGQADKIKSLAFNELYAMAA